jgi:hypothetical protein
VVVRLKQKVDKSITPYEVETLMADEAKKAAVFVGKSKDFAPNNEKKLAELPRHYGDCKITTIKGDVVAREIQSNCDLGHGSSAGGLFRPGPAPVLVAIAKNQNTGCEDGTGANGRGPSKPDCWASLFVPVGYEMTEVLKKAVAEGQKPKRK